MFENGPSPRTSVAACAAAMAGLRRGSTRVAPSRVAPTAAFGRPIASVNLEATARPPRTQRSERQPATNALGGPDLGRIVARNGRAAAAIVLGTRPCHARRHGAIARHSVEQPGFRSRPCVARSRPYGTPAMRPEPGEETGSDRRRRRRRAGSRRASETENVSRNDSGSSCGL
jgi:hypothetical protein